MRIESLVIPNLAPACCWGNAEVEYMEMHYEAEEWENSGAYTVDDTPVHHW